MSKRYYWLKLKHDFFEQQEVQIIERMSNGKDYVLFYLKLLCKSVTTEGKLRFNEQIPYDEEMLSIITNTDPKIVRDAVGVFQKFHMMEILDDGTYFMSEVEKMMGSETYWAQKKREQRSKTDNKLDNFQNKSSDCPQCPTKREREETDIHTNTEREIKAEEQKKSLSGKPTFTLEMGWNETVAIYPRKTNIESAHETWIEMVQAEPGIENRTADTIYKAIKLYLRDHKEKNPDDEDCRFVLGFKKWLENESAYWIKLVKRRDQEHTAYLQKQAEVSADE